MGKGKPAKHITRPQTPNGGSIPKPELPPRIEGLQFSFKFLDLDSNDKFSVTDREAAYFVKLLERFKDVCGITHSDFIACRSSSLKSNKIDFSRSSEPKGFTCLNPQLRAYAAQAFEFEITRNEHGRVHGFLRENVFYVIWLDPRHRLFP